MGEKREDMEKIKRLASYAEKKSSLEHGNVFSMAEIEDVLELIATRQCPDGYFSDNECNLWSLIRRKLDIDF